MVISDEKVEAILEALHKTMDQMCLVQQENSELHKELISILKSNANLNGKMKAEKKTGESSSDGDNVESKSRTNRPKPVRPIIEEGVDDFGWNIFLDKWERYKQVAELKDEREVCLELRDSCSADVNRMLFEFIGVEELNKTSLTEVDLLEDIKSVAVRSIHKEVHRNHFNLISQDGSEKVTKFVGRLKAKSILCDFNVKCECGKRVSYAEEMVAQRLTTGVTNPEHQSKVLGEAEELDTLKKKVDRLISLETTDEASNKMRIPFSSRSTPITASQYKRDQKQKVVGQNRKLVGEDSAEKMRRGRSKFRRPNDRRRRCRGCGRSSHPHGKTMARKDCPAWGQKCNTCEGENHFSKVCERRSRASFAGDDTSGSEEDYFTETEDECFSDCADAEECSHDYAVTSQDFCRCHHPDQRR